MSVGMKPAEAAAHEIPNYRKDYSNLRICARCVYDDTIDNISFDESGVCSYCHLHDSLDRVYPTGATGRKILENMADQMRKSSRGRKYDCIVGVSGGCDSSYLMHLLIELGLRPLAVHFDNTWNSPISTQNIYKLVNKLNIPLETYVVNSKEYDNLYRSFMLAGVPDIEAPTDIGFIAALYLAAEKHGLKYVIEGHSFRTEGVAPLSWLYMDGKFIESVHKQHGTIPLQTYPNMTLSRFLRWSAIRNIKRVRPLYYIDYHKENTKRMLQDRYQWEWYGGHHLENRFTAFFHSYFMPRRFNVDTRANGYAGLVRSGQADRQEMLAELRHPPDIEEEIVNLVKKRLGFSDKEFHRVMNQPRHSWHEFKTYKKTFETLRPLFYILVKLGRVPESFYVKFCFPLRQLGAITASSPQSAK